MKFTTVSTLLALFAAANAVCEIKGCSEFQGQGVCTSLKNINDPGCHSNEDRVFQSFIWSGDDCPNQEFKYLCGWRSGACNGARGAIQRISEVPRAQLLNNVEGEQFRSFKFMNSDFC